MAFNFPDAHLTRLLKKKGFALLSLHAFYRAFILSNRISIIGGGGKTSLMISLGNFFRFLGKRVLMTTTTHLSKNSDYGADIIHSVDVGAFNDVMPSHALLIGDKLNDESERYCAPDAKALEKAAFFFDKIIVEADGSRMMPLKCHGSNEPVIPQWTELVISVIGLDGIGRAIGDAVHRHEIYEAEQGLDERDEIGVRDVINLIQSPCGCFCAVPETMERILLFNKADVIEGTDKTADGILDLCKGRGRYLISLKEGYAAVSKDCL